MTRDNESYGQGAGPYKPITGIRIPIKLFHTGLNVEDSPTDIDDSEAVDMNNVRILRGGIAPEFALHRFPFDDIPPASTPILHITSFEKKDGTKLSVRMRYNAWEWFNGEDWVDVPGSVTGVQNQRLYTTVLDDKLIASNGSNRLLSWDGVAVNPVGNLSGEAPSAFFVTRIGQRLLAAYARPGTTGDFDPNGVFYSADGDILEWTDSVLGAGNLSVKPEGTNTIANFITGLSNLERGTVLYRQRSIVLISRTGVRAAPFRFTTIDFGHGTESPYSIANGGLAFGDFFLGFDYVVYHFDGQSPPVPIGLPIQRRLEERIDDLKECVGFINPVTMEYCLLSPSLGQPKPRLGDLHAFSIRDYIRKKKLSWRYRRIDDINATTAAYMTKLLGTNVPFVDTFSSDVTDRVDPTNPPLFEVATIPVPPIPIPGGVRTMYGAFDMLQELSGLNPQIKPTPDVMRSNSTANQWPDIIEYAYNHDVQIIGKFVGGSNSNFRVGGTGSDACFFSPQKWKDRWNLFTSAVQSQGLLTLFKEAVRDKIIIGHNALDDFLGVDTNCDSGGFTRGVTFDELEGTNGVFRHAKTVWPWMPQGVRARTTELYNLGGVARQYKFLDFTINQWKCGLSSNNGVQYAADIILRGDQCGLAYLGGGNLLNRGCGNTLGWGCKKGCTSGLCGMSPAEIENIFGGQLLNPKIFGLMIWAYDGSNCTDAGTSNAEYYNDPKVTEALYKVWNNFALGRSPGLINIRNDLVPPF